MGLLSGLLPKTPDEFGYPLPRHDGKVFEVKNDIISEFIIKRLVPVVGVKPFPLPELHLMTAAALYFTPTHIFDWGTHIGKATRIFWEIKQAFKQTYVQYTIDLPASSNHPEHPKHLRGDLIKKMPEINQLDGDGVTEALRVQHKLQNSTPLFFIDGDHEYKTVKRELSWLTQFVEKPIMLIHDTFYQTPEAGYNVGPFQAVEEMMLEQSGRFNKIETNLGLPGMTLLYPRIG